MPHLSIHTPVKRKCSHHLTDCPDSLICLEKEYKMFMDSFKKLPNTVCRWKKIDQTIILKEVLTNVARAPGDIATIIFFEDPFWSHTERLGQCFRWESEPTFTSWIPEPKLVQVPIQQHHVREMSLCLCLMCQMITVLWDAMSGRQEGIQLKVRIHHPAGLASNLNFSGTALPFKKA